MTVEEVITGVEVVLLMGLAGVMLSLAAYYATGGGWR